MNKSELFDQKSFLFYISFLKNSKNIKKAYLKSIEFNEGILVPISKSIFTSQLKELFYEFNKKKINYKKKFFNFFHKANIGFLISNKEGKYLGIIILKKNMNKEIIDLDYVFFKTKKLNLFKVNALNTTLNWCSNTLNIKNFKIDITHNLNDFSLMQKKILKDFSKKYNKKKKTFEIYVDKTNSTKILTAGPSISEIEKYNVYDATENGWNKNFSNYLKKFEVTFAKKVLRKYCISTSSCTGALHIALMALDIGPGDEVIVPDITWVSTAHVVEAVGAKPIFAVVNLDDWTIEIESVKKLISKKTKVIMPVHLYGMPANCVELKKIAIKHKIKIVEDAAPAIGASYKNISCGNLGEFSAFSFQGAKLLVTGEGGMLTTNNYKLYKKALKISDFGRSLKKTFWIDSPGVKYKMSNIQAALGLGQLSRVNEMIRMKRKIFEWYNKYLHKHNCTLITEPENSKSIYWMTSILLKKKYDRDKLIKILKKNKIDSRPCFPSISSYPIWKNKINKIHIKLLKNSKIISQNGINLPSGVLLREKDIKRVCKVINSFST